MAAIRETASGAAVSVREARRSEHPAVREVLAAAYQEYGSVLPPGAMEPYLEDLLDLEGRAGTGSLLVAEWRRRIVGTVTFFPDAAAEGLGWPSGWAGLRALGVAPAQRGLGIGRRLMDECFDRARALGAPVLCLHTAAFMTAAVTMYEAMGFERVPAYDFEASDFVEGGSDSVMVIAYRIDL
jgi:predicted N-acetyltransferase YhbS